MEFTLKHFFLALIDVVIVFVIWHHFFIPWNKNKFKSMFICFGYSLLAAFYLYHPYRLLFSHIIIITLISLTYKQSVRKSLFQFTCVFVFGSMIQIPLWGIVAAIIDSKNHYYLTQMVTESTFLIITWALFKYLPIKSFVQQHILKLEKVSYILLNLYLMSISYSIMTVSYELTDYIFLTLLMGGFIAINIAFAQSIMDTKEQSILMKSYESHKNMLLPIIDELQNKQHDFKNHLTAIYGFCQHEDQPTSSIKSYIENLNTSLKNLDLLLFIKNKVIGAIIYSKACEAEANNIQFDFQLPPYEVSFPFQDHEYAAVVSNLLDNAFEAPADPSNARKQVLLKLDRTENGSCIEVSNNGIPIPYEDLSKIFKRGFTSKKEKRGHGLGLYNVKKLVEKYGGVVEVVMEGPLTLFRVQFNATVSSIQDNSPRAFSAQ